MTPGLKQASNTPSQVGLESEAPPQMTESCGSAEEPECSIAPVLTAEQEAKLWRRIDLRLMPIITLMYLLSFMDRGNIGNAKLDGLLTQLNLTGNKYNIALTMFFIPYSLLEFPSNLAIQVIRPSRWLPAIMVLWGLCMMLMGFVKTYPQLVGVRVCLGTAEAGFFPGVAYYLTLWYPKYMYQYRIAMFTGAATMAGAFSGLLAFAINFMNGDGGLEGWSWIFVLEGLATVLVASVATFVMVDYAPTAKFLTAAERAFIIERRGREAIQGERHHLAQQVWAAFTDWQVWALSVIYISISVPLYGITYFLPTIINKYCLESYTVLLSTDLQQFRIQYINQSAPHYSPLRARYRLLVTFAHWSDKLKLRSPFIFAAQLIALVGYIINISDAPSGVKYFGTYLCVIGSYSSGPGSISWLANNLGGRYKRAVGMALQMSVGNLGGAVACNIFRSQDEPRYLLGHGLEIAFISIGLVTLPVTVLVYKRINSRRDREELLQEQSGEKAEPEPEEGGAGPMGDRCIEFQEVKLWRKIDLRLMPIITLMYLLSFMDRGNIGNAKLDGLMTQLNLTGNKYNIALTMYFIPYSLLEFPSNLAIQVIRPSRWLPGIMVLWAFPCKISSPVAILMGYSLMPLKDAYGLREDEYVYVSALQKAGLYPGVAYYLTLWYPKYMYQYRFALFTGAATMAGAFSGLLAFAINFMNGDGGLEGWSWIFVLEGLATVLVALVAAFVMVDYAPTAKFLTAKERAFVISRRGREAIRGERHHLAQQVWAAFTDWQVWAFSAIQFSICMPVYGITYFLPTIINKYCLEPCTVLLSTDLSSSFGYSTSISQLLTIPPYVLATISLVTFAHWSDKLKLRSPFVFAAQLIALVGYIINISGAPSGVKYFGTYLCVIGSYSSGPGSISWLANNLRRKDEPRYLLGHGLEIAFISIGLLMLPVIVLVYGRINSRRDREELLKQQSGEKAEPEPEEGGPNQWVIAHRVSGTRFERRCPAAYRSICTL
ncbi:major facilitator superfamily domain-containing protein [Melanogaster broomeanus]|nr:major facilitator superfamily domain-containing protein [Melanogaster broomeanus]